MRVVPASENACIVYFGDKAVPEISQRIGHVANTLQRHFSTKIDDLIPSYISLYIEINSANVTLVDFIESLKDVLDNMPLDWESADPAISVASAENAPLISLPVWYSPESGADLKEVGEAANLSISDVIDLHSQTEYRVYAIGFAPGFAYLGDVDDRIALPRLDTPRKCVPKGSVAIAERQTAVYPLESPGGWNLIGRCPLPMFDVKKYPPMALEVGSRVRFNPISEAEFNRLVTRG